jgi:two-component system sensor histidine kinase BaeS
MNAIAVHPCRQMPRRERGFSLLTFKLFALLGLATVLSVGATTWLFSRHLETGFVGYLNAVQNDRLDTLAQAVAAYYRANGELESLRGEGWRRILGADAVGRDNPLEDRPPRGPGPEDRPPPRRDRPGAQGGDFPKGPPPKPRDFLSLGPRLALVGEDGTLIVGRRPPRDAELMTRDVDVDGKRIARLLLAPLPQPVETRDTQFLSLQRQSIFFTAAIGVALSLLLAFLVARMWVRRIRAVEQAAARFAGGRFEGRLADTDRDEIGALARSLDSMADSLSRLEQSRRKWLADVAHELRTPLTVLQANIEALIDGVRPTNLDALQVLAVEVKHLSRLTDDLHQLALSDMKALPADFRPVDAAAVARRAVERWQPQAQQAGLTLRCTGADRAELSADEGRLTQLCDNLLANSLRYTDAPGEVKLGVERGAEEVRLVFDDSPPSVEPSVRGGLFEPLFRPDAARSRTKGGSGLGLALSRAIVELHGGRIEARDSPLGGLRIVAHLPLARPA